MAKAIFEIAEGFVKAADCTSHVVLHAGNGFFKFLHNNFWRVAGNSLSIRFRYFFCRIGGHIKILPSLSTPIPPQAQLVQNQNHSISELLKLSSIPESNPERLRVE